MIDDSLFESSIMALVFLICGMLLAYTVLGYPLLMALHARLHARPPTRGPYTGRITAIVCARNESAGIGDKIRNLLAMDLPRGMLDVIVVSDGSTDGTDEIVESFPKERVSLVRLDVPRGKAAALNAGVLKAEGDLLLFCDVRQQFEPSVAQRLAEHFADDTVGAVSGRLVVCPVTETGGAAGVGSYWDLEVRLRADEARTGSTIGATGAIYAVRRSLFEPLPPGTILDDVLIPMHIAMRGYRVLFEPAAVAIDRKSVTDRTELRRKVRTLYGNLQLMQLAPELFSPVQNPQWFRFLSHKVMRLLMPFLLATCLISSLAAGRLLAYLGWAQLAFWAIAALALVSGTRAFPWRVISGFLLLNVAVLLAWGKLLDAERDVWSDVSSHDDEPRRREVQR